MRVDVAALCDGTAGRITLGDEDGRFPSQVGLIATALAFGRCIVEVDAAVAEFAVVQVGLFGALAGQFRHARYGFALLLAFLDFLLNDFGDVKVAVEVVVYVFLDEIAHKFVHAHAREGEGVAVHVLVGSHSERAEFDFRLAFKERFDDAQGDSGHQSVAHVLHVEIFAKVFLDGACDMLFECALVRTALCGMLSVDEGIVFLAVLRRMREGNIYTFSLQVYDGVEARCRHVVVEQVFKAVAAADAASVVEDG